MKRMADFVFFRYKNWHMEAVREAQNAAKADQAAKDAAKVAEEHDIPPVMQKKRNFVLVAPPKYNPNIPRRKKKINNRKTKNNDRNNKKEECNNEEG